MAGGDAGTGWGGSAGRARETTEATSTADCMIAEQRVLASLGWTDRGAARLEDFFWLRSLRKLNKLQGRAIKQDGIDSGVGVDKSGDMVRCGPWSRRRTILAPGQIWLRPRPRPAPTGSIFRKPHHAHARL
jgi:hypothetical protein